MKEELKKLLEATMICLICGFYYIVSIILISAFFIGIFGGGK